jgi:tetratricopeptide (TPR) repeat protein
VYRAAPKRLRAELHERFADRLDAAYPDLPDLDEFAGYHLEQAYRLRTELGESDRRTERLAENGGRRLGEAGVRAAKRADVPASIGLLRRAVSMLPPGTPPRGDLLCELGSTLDASGESENPGAVLERAIEEARVAGDRRVELRARMELEYVRLPRISGATADALLDAVSAAIPVLEAASDYRCLGRAWLLAGWVQGGRRGQHKAREEAAERALSYYRQSTWPSSTCAGEIANALYYGPTPVPAAIARCETLLRSEVTIRYGSANVEAYLGGLVAQAGDFDLARTLIESSRATYDELGHRTALATFSGVILADVELLADDSVAAEAILRWVCDELARTEAFSRLASRAGDLAEALYRQQRFEEAAEWIALGERHSAADDLDARLLLMPVRAKIAARRGDLDDAIALGSEAAALSESSDGLNRRAAIQMDLGEVLLLAGRGREAPHALRRAVALYEAKGNVIGAARVRSFQAELARV